jgi:5'-3' exonuclease
LSPKKIGGLLYKIQNPKEGEDVGSLSISEVDGKKILFDLNCITPSTYDIYIQS